MFVISYTAVAGSMDPYSYSRVPRSPKNRSGGGGGTGQLRPDGLDNLAGSGRSFTVDDARSPTGSSTEQVMGSSNHQQQEGRDSFVQIVYNTE